MTLPAIDLDTLRTRFARALSDMYRAEVPAYGELVALVETVNGGVLEHDPALRARLSATGGLERLSQERHGAIRVGSPAELHGMRRLFAGFGMKPVDYYDLGVAGIPVHSTAFRAVSDAALAASPFRVFTSLLRTDAIADTALRETAERTVQRRSIFQGRTLGLAERAASDAGLGESEADELVDGALETFRWHTEATVSAGLYAELAARHPLIADVVSFKGPHINHLTPRTLDIDAVQARMPLHGIRPKAVIEGPPRRACPILLRQTSFRAIEEPIDFTAADGRRETGAHTARFGEVEQRGAALTPKGRALYDRLLGEVPERANGSTAGPGAHAHDAALNEVFAAFPDDPDTLRREKLAYFRYRRTDAGSGVARTATDRTAADLDRAVESGEIVAEPIVYEDFLPISAAGIFRSNLTGGVARAEPAAARTDFEAALGCGVANGFALYERLERESVAHCRPGASDP